MKKCFKCGTEKPLSEFYKHKKMADGHLNKCKSCTKKDVTKHRKDNIERIRKYDVERAKRPHVRARVLEYQKRWRAENREKQRAQRKIAYYVRSGQLTPKPCEVCGATEHIHAHHEDYSKPLDVIWLCPVHHHERHEKIKKQN